MAFHKIAFIAKDHKRITEHIMGGRFNEELFKLVNDYIDKERGRDHRERHGHDQDAEKYIKQTWGDDGVEIFKIHILSDWLYDDLGTVVNDVYRRLRSGDFEPPYYSADSRDSRPQFPMESVTVIGCMNCGRHDIDLGTCFAPLCTQCRTARNLESCVQCRTFFARQDRIESPDCPGKYICPVCKADYYAE
jgi:hypothetical protein